MLFIEDVPIFFPGKAENIPFFNAFSKVPSCKEPQASPSNPMTATLQVPPLKSPFDVTTYGGFHQYGYPQMDGL